jgi:hypothetical protein
MSDKTTHTLLMGAMLGEKSVRGLTYADASRKWKPSYRSKTIWCRQRLNVASGWAGRACGSESREQDAIAIATLALIREGGE